MDRRTFLRQTAVCGFGAGLGALTPWNIARAGDLTRITILHTNDTHARIEPFAESAPRYAGLGGVARRASLVKQLRRDHPHSLLLDAGDVFQGTPYFNKYNGALDLDVMSKMGYDASTIGNHEFDNGVDGFEQVMGKATFPFVSSNYDYGTTRMGLIMQKFILRQLGDIRVGIFGLGISFENLVLPHLHRGISWMNPLDVSEQMVKRLRHYHHCDMVICLSHLGYRYSDPDRISDQMIAENINGIDLIIGGHTHTFMEEPELIVKEDGSRTWISQVGFAGIVLGRMDFYFDSSRALLAAHHNNYTVGADLA